MNVTDCFEEFSQKLIACLEQTYSGVAGGCASNYKVQIWRQFHVKRLTTLCDIWRQLVDSLKFYIDPLLQQFVNQELYVQFYWSLSSIDIDTEDNAALLLKEIIELWLTIRGFSIAGQWLEIYKSNRQVTTKKSKSLRKTLKRGRTLKSSSDIFSHTC